jgi:predicted Zn-dependent peptidase
VYAGTSPENGEKVIAEIQLELQKLLRGGLTEPEFRSAKAQLRSGFVLGLESSSGRMQSLGRSMLLLDRLLPAEETLHKIEAITMEDVLRVARETLTAEPSAAVVGKKAERYLKRIGGELHG